MKAYEVKLKVIGGYKDQTRKVFVQANSKNEIEKCSDVVKIWYRKDMTANECECEIVSDTITSK